MVEHKAAVEENMYPYQLEIRKIINKVGLNGDRRAPYCGQMGGRGGGGALVSRSDQCPVTDEQDAGSKEWHILILSFSPPLTRVAYRHALC